MFKTPEQTRERLNSKENIVNRFGRNVVTVPPVDLPSIPSEVVQEIPTNIPTDSPIETIALKQPGNVSKPKLTKKQKNEIALRARSGETQTTLAQEFGVSQSAIGEIEQGRTKVDENFVQTRLDKIADVAMTKLLDSLGYMTPEKMEKAKVKELSGIAADMSRVVSNLRANEDEQGPKIVVQIYAPELKKEGSYQTIDV